MTELLSLSGSYFAATFLIALLALILDAIIGDPDWLWRRLPHPVVWIGWVISIFEKALNTPLTLPSEQKKINKIRLNGAFTIVVITITSVGLGTILQHLLFELGSVGIFLTALIASVFLAQNSLYIHVCRVWEPLAKGDLAAARKAVSMIVGRDPEKLDEAGIARASIESTAENYSDGIVAPLFWLLLGGLPGLIAYKAINTADSMIGHMNDRYRYFGWAAAKLDDIVNFIPARISMILLLLGGRFRAAPKYSQQPKSGFWNIIKKIVADAPKHRSPNAGWPEGAVAYQLDIALSGPRVYGDRTSEEPYVNEAGRKDIGAAEIKSTLDIFKLACIVQLAMVGAGLAAFLLI